MKDEYLLVLSTFPNPEVARQIGTMLVDLQLAACVNLIPSVDSIYRWKGKIEQDRETLALIKTTRSNYQAVETRIQEKHPAEVPEIIAIPIERGAGFLSGVDFGSDAGLTRISEMRGKRRGRNARPWRLDRFRGLRRRQFAVMVAFPMSETQKTDDGLWHALNEEARAALETRSYARKELAARLSAGGVDAGEIATEIPGPKEGLKEVWIPGVEIFPRKVWQQRHRGWFGEFARLTEGRLHEIGLNPRQWSTATMFAGTAKGFHIHPPSIPRGQSAEAFLRKLYVEEPRNYAGRPYGEEQWDSMFFVQGAIEFLLVDERAGLPRRAMRFFIDGDNIPGPNNVGLVIPAGVAHALRCAGSQDVIMVYGTSTVFHPPFEGRIASEVEACPLPEGWQRYLGR